MKKYSLFFLLVLLIFVTGCVGLLRTNAIKGTVFADEYIENAIVKVFDLDGNQVIEGEFETDNYGRFSIPIPTGLKFPVIILASFDIPEEQERTDALASVVEESFYSEQILVNPVTSVFTAYMFRMETSYAEAISQVREALNVPPEVNVLSQLHPKFETSYFSMKKLSDFVHENFGGVYRDFIEVIVEAIVGGAKYNFGVGATLDIDISSIAKDLLKGITTGIVSKGAVSAISWVMKSLFGLGDQSAEMISEILNQVQEINDKLDVMSAKLDTIDAEIQSILTKLDKQYYDSYVRMVDQNYFTPIETCTNKYMFITTLDATTTTDVAIQELMYDIQISKLDQVMLNIKKVIVGGTADTSYMSLFEIFITNAMNAIRSAKLIDGTTDTGFGFSQRCPADSPVFIEYVQAYIGLFKALTTRQLLALNLLVEYEHKQGSSLSQLHLQNYNSYIAEEVEVFWHWLETFVTYIVGGEGLMLNPAYDADKAWFYNEADNAALKAMGLDSGIVVRVFWNTEPMSLPTTLPSFQKTLGILLPAFNVFRNSASGIKLTLDKQDIQLTAIDEALEASDPLGTYRLLGYTYQDTEQTVEPGVVLRRYVFENLSEGKYTISRSTNNNVVQTPYAITLLENTHKNICNNLFIAEEYLDETKYALNIGPETSYVQSLAISAYAPSLRVNNLQREIIYGRSTDPTDPDHIGVLNVALNRYMKIDDEAYWQKNWILFIPTWDSFGVDLVKVNSTNRTTSGRYSSWLILTNKGDKGTGDSWGWSTGPVTKDHAVWLRATTQLSDMCLAPYNLSKYYTIDTKDDKYKYPSTTYCLYLNHDTAQWDLFIEPTGINVLGTLFGTDKLYYGEIVRLRHASSGKYVSYHQVYTSSTSSYNCGTVNDTDKYQINNWWVIYR